MTEQTDSAPINDPTTQTEQAVVGEALAVIDGALAQMMQRELISSGEVADLLLDVRSLLTASAGDSTAPEGSSTPEPVS
jgi:hypothetical protein